MTALNKQDFLNIINGAKPVACEVDGFGTVFVKKLVVSEQAALSKLTDDGVNATLHMIAYSLCDENGKRLFNDSDIKQLGNMHADQVTALSNAIGEVNGFEQTVADAKKN